MVVWWYSARALPPNDHSAAIVELGTEGTVVQDRVIAAFLGRERFRASGRTHPSAGTGRLDEVLLDANQPYLVLHDGLLRRGLPGFL